MSEENVNIELDPTPLAGVAVTIPMNWDPEWEQWESVAFRATRAPVLAKFATASGHHFELTEESFELWEILDGSYCLVIAGCHSDDAPTIIVLGFEND